MTGAPSKKKPASKAGKTACKSTVKKRQLKKAASSEAKEIITNILDSAREQLRKFGDKLSEEKDIMPHMSDATREQLRRLGDKLNEATGKGVHVAKDVAERVRHFASEATELTKLKIEIHKMKSAQDKLLFEMGEKLWNLNKSKKPIDVESVFADDFEKLKELKVNISKKERELKKISL